MLLPLLRIKSLTWVGAVDATPPPSGTFEFLKIFFAASLGAFFTLAVTWLKAHRDAVKSRCDEFIAAISDAADLGSEYWLAEENAEDLKLIEARLLGFQMKFMLLKEHVFSSFQSFDRQLLEDDLASFLDACTGGRFSESGRPPDLVRARRCQIDAAQVSTRVIKGFEKAHTLGGYFMRKLGID